MRGRGGWKERGTTDAKLFSNRKQKKNRTDWVPTARTPVMTRTTARTLAPPSINPPLATSTGRWRGCAKGRPGRGPRTPPTGNDIEDFRQRQQRRGRSASATDGMTMATMKRQRCVQPGRRTLNGASFQVNHADIGRWCVLLISLAYPYD
jgi:hypothetical protein